MSASSFAPSGFKAALDGLLAPLGRAGEGALCVALSGGSDSMALLVLAHAAYPSRVVALTVDHQLRSESAEEARQVGAWAQALGVPHRTLVWDGAKPRSGIQAAARGARYRLLAAAAVELGRAGCAAPLLTAHTQDDQAETFLLRLAHHSDLAGLGAMRAASELPGAPPVPLLRPLLDVSKEALRHHLRATGQPWIEDPSNESEAFERVRLRRVLPALAQAGLHSDVLARASRLMARIDRQLLRGAEDRALYRLTPEGCAVLRRVALLTLPKPLALRQLSRLIRIIGGAPYPPSGRALDRLLAHLVDGNGRGMTLAGCQFARGGAFWLVCRELRPAARPAPCQPPAGSTVWWDNRFWVHLPETYPPFELRPLGKLDVSGANREPGHLGRRLEALSAQTLPGLWLGAKLAGVPTIARDFTAFGRIRDRPTAVFAGEQRVDGGLGGAWLSVIAGTKSKQCVIPTVS